MNRFVLVILGVLMAGWMSRPQSSDKEDPYQPDRLKMVEEQIRFRGVRDKNVLEAMRKVKRHLFVPPAYRAMSYRDRPLPIGEEQTISQPYIVGLMTELLKLKGGEKVLEVGTGSGYQAAILAELCAKVYTIEILPTLSERAQKLLHELGYQNIFIKTGDGYLGWEEFAPYDAIIVTAAPAVIPEALIRQLKDGGRLVIPVGTLFQELQVILKDGKEFKTQNVVPVSFVPMVHAKPADN